MEIEINTLTMIVGFVLVLAGFLAGYILQRKETAQRLQKIGDDYPAMDKKVILNIVEKFGIKTTEEDIEYILNHPEKK